MKTLYVLGDSHAHQLSIAFRLNKFTGFSDIGIDVQFRLFGAVKQGIRPHHKMEDNRIILLEDNWSERALPFAASDIGDPDTAYVLSLPFNVTPMLRQLEFNKMTTDPRDAKRQFLSAGLVSELITRRNRLGVTLACDMQKIGLRTTVLASPRPFVNNSFARGNAATLAGLVDQFFDQTSQSLADGGVNSLHQPPETLEADGIFTQARYNSGDEQHAIKEYYAQMLNHMVNAAPSFF